MYSLAKAIVKSVLYIIIAYFATLAAARRHVVVFCISLAASCQQVVVPFQHVALYGNQAAVACHMRPQPGGYFYPHNNTYNLTQTTSP